MLFFLKNQFLRFSGPKRPSSGHCRRTQKQDGKRAFFFIFCHGARKTGGDGSKVAIAPRILFWVLDQLHHAENTDTDIVLGTFEELEQRF